tara:strand:- start:443 stop:2125 length:1683 start_codon:yes stop_codon:yes gene_type:complete
MSSIIRIKRSSGTAKPSSLLWGEQAYVTGIGSYGGLNQYKDRIFIGDDGSNVNPVGGYYYASMMEHAPGAIAGVTNTRNSDGGIVAVLDSDRKVDEWNVDNLKLDTNTLSSSNTDGDIILDPNGSGEVVIPDDTFLSFGTGKDTKIEYDENGTDKLRFSGSQISFDNTTESTDKDTGSVVFEGGVGIEKNLNIGGDLDVGGSVSVGELGSAEIGHIRIKDNIISSSSASNDKIYIDPFPDGLSNQGDVIIKGNLQVDGTTTAVNSTNVTVNDPIFTIGDVTSERTVMSTVSVGANQITIDSVVGINTGDTVSGSASLPNSGLTTITAYDTAGKTITIQGTTTAGITTQTQLTITHAYDTNTDRGIAFNYNVGVGTANAKTGFFGYVDTDSNTNSNAPEGAWTYVPDGAINNSTVSGTRGYLDIKGIYYQTADYNTGGVVYFDSNGLQTSTNAVASPVDTSKQLLTAITKITLGLPSNVTLVKGDIVKQDTSNAYGVVESAVNNAASIPLIGVEGTFVTNQNIRKEGNNGSVQNLSVIPNDVTTNYTNKPSWTSTLDGGTF